MLPEIAAEELSAVLEAVAGELLIEAGVEAPPVDAVAVAHALRLGLAWDDRQSGRARLVRSRWAAAGGATILLRPEPRAERRQWAVAHELGEHKAAEVFARLGVAVEAASPGIREQVANWLAGRLLLPGVWLAADGPPCDWDLLALKQRYTTASHELIARRMLEVAPPAVISIVDNGRLTFRRGKGHAAGSALAPLEQTCCREAHRTGQPSGRQQGPLRVRAWPIHEADWKREFLRAERDESD